MDKKVFNFLLPEDKVLNIGGQEIIVKPYLTLAEQLQLINEYLEIYFHSEIRGINEDERDYFDAEYALKMAIINHCSSITITGAFENLFYNPETYNAIINSVANYDEFMNLLCTIVKNVEDQMAQKKQVGAVLESLYAKIEILLAQVSESVKNLTPETLEKLKETGTSLIDKLNSTPLVKEVFKESGK